MMIETLIWVSDPPPALSCSSVFLYPFSLNYFFLSYYSLFV